MTEPEAGFVTPGSEPDGLQPVNPTEAFEQAALSPSPEVIELVLFVAGSAPRSLRAVKIVRMLCEEYPPDRHSLEIVDIYQQPLLAEEAGVLAVPMLVKKRPLPTQKFIGDLANLDAVRRGLNLPSRAEPPASGDAP